MKILLIALILITLPAIAALIYSLIAGNKLVMVAALASFGLNSLPFLAGYLLTRGQSADVGH
ncbi:MAG TPA: hypothetical protein VFH27_14875 [Longimicrobiaceae bacterium]|nr:hypothetical protein [Longimicrobiaceae bacterium]